MSRSEQYTQGQRNAFKAAVAWLHERAGTMNDPHAKGILDSAAFDLGREKTALAARLPDREGLPDAATWRGIVDYLKALDKAGAVDEPMMQLHGFLSLKNGLEVWGINGSEQEVKG